MLCNSVAEDLQLNNAYHKIQEGDYWFIEAVDPLCTENSINHQVR